MPKDKRQIFDDRYLLKFNNYEDYLDSLITAKDLYYLRSKSISRQIIELGYHTAGTLDRETFYKRLKYIKRYIYLQENPYDLCSKYIDIKDPLLYELALREEANRSEQLNTIIFIRYTKPQSQVSTYIDYSYRLKNEDWQPYFKQTQLIRPRKSDLSYYDWKYRIIVVNESPNFKPLVDGDNGLVFQNNHDLKYVAVSSHLTAETDPARISIYSDIYGHAILYDHNIKIQ